MGRCEGATAEKAVPFPSDRPSIPLRACVKRCKGYPESVRAVANGELPGEGEKVRSPCSRCKIPSA